MPSCTIHSKHGPTKQAELISSRIQIEGALCADPKIIIRVSRSKSTHQCSVLGRSSPLCCLHVSLEHCSQLRREGCTRGAISIVVSSSGSLLRLGRIKVVIPNEKSRRQRARFADECRHNTCTHTAWIWCGGNESSERHIADPLARGSGNGTSSLSGLAIVSFPLLSLSLVFLWVEGFSF